MSQKPVIFLNSSPSGAELLDEQLENNQENMLTTHSGVNRPSYAKNGTLWLDTSDINAKKLKMFNGTSDVVIGTLNESTLTFMQSASNIATDVEFAGGTAIDKATNVKQVKSVDNTIAIKIYSPSTVYSLNQWVLGTVDSEIAIYQSLIDNNSSALTDASKWVKVELGGGSNSVVFSVNEASKDASGNPNYIGLNSAGTKLTFNGNIKYTQANGESKEYADITNINIQNGYVMLNNGVASVVPALEVQQSAPLKYWQQPNNLTSNGTLGQGDFAIYSTYNVANGQLFNAINNDGWFSGFGNNLKIYLYFKNGVVLKNIEWVTYDTNRNPTNYSIRGSNSNSDYVSIIESQTAVAGSATNMAMPDNEIVYNYIEIDITAFNTGEFNCKSLVITAETVQVDEVWFNPYNNQAKQYDGTDWVDYNGVPVGEVKDGEVYTYQYNTQKNVEPFAWVATDDTRLALNNLVLIDCWEDPNNSRNWYEIYLKKQNKGDYKYWCRQSGDNYGGNNAYISFFIPFLSLPSISGIKATTGTWIDGNLGIHGLGLIGFSMHWGQNNTAKSFQWIAEGYCDKPEEIL